MKKHIYLFLLLLISNYFSHAQNSLSLSPLSTGFTAPLGIENCGDNRLFIVQRTGQVMICDVTGKKYDSPFLDISDRIKDNGSEQGLLGLAFHPDYLTNGFIYVNYINKDGNTQISRFKASASNRNKIIAASEKFLLQISQPYSNHNGGCLRFGPDGYLYIGLGDGGSGGDPQNNAQNPSSLLGKMLRIDVDHGNPYAVPATNPFKNVAGYKPEIWALGLRNPWRFSFDALSGALVIADVGQSDWEEINFQPPSSKGGENYGWRCYEGTHTYNTSGCKAQSAYDLPKYEYPHSETTGDCSVTGGFVYRGQNNADMYGKYYFADYCSGIIRSLSLTNNVVTKKDLYTGDTYAYSSFGEDKNKELYLANIVNGTIYRIASGPLAMTAAARATPTLSVAPNPAKNNFIAEYKTLQSGNCTVSISNAMGMQLFTAKYTAIAGTNTWRITAPAAAKGSCYLTVTTASGSRIRQSILLQ